MFVCMCGFFYFVCEQVDNVFSPETHQSNTRSPLYSSSLVSPQPTHRTLHPPTYVLSSLPSQRPVPSLPLDSCIWLPRMNGLGGERMNRCVGDGWTTDWLGRERRQRGIVLQGETWVAVPADGGWKRTRHMRTFKGKAQPFPPLPAPAFQPFVTAAQTPGLKHPAIYF